MIFPAIWQKIHGRRSCFNRNLTKKRTFGSLLGISYYLTKEDFQKLVYRIAEIMSEDSTICMDYPCEDEGTESEKIENWQRKQMSR